MFRDPGAGTLSTGTHQWGDRLPGPGSLARLTDLVGWFDVSAATLKGEP